jgi:hypothetical protein
MKLHIQGFPVFGMIKSFQTLLATVGGDSSMFTLQRVNV